MEGNTQVLVFLWKESGSESHSVVSDSLWLWLYSPWNFPGQNTGVGSLSLLQGIFPSQGWNPGLPNCRQILYQLSHKGSPRALEWGAYPFSRGSSDLGIEPGSPTLQEDSLPTELSGKSLFLPEELLIWTLYQASQLLRPDLKRWAPKRSSFENQCVHKPHKTLVRNTLWGLAQTYLATPKVQSWGSWLKNAVFLWKSPAYLSSQLWPESRLLTKNTCKDLL